MFVRVGGGPGFTYRTTGSLHPRDANEAQPRLQQVDDLPNLLQQMFGNLGVQGQVGGANQTDNSFAGMGPFQGLLQGLFNPANMQHGDAVYSQEALDRVITQLMEQNQSGNAP